MTAYPNLATVPWHLAVVNAGDCLYLPYMWLHNVSLSITFFDLIRSTCNDKNWTIVTVTNVALMEF